MEIGIENGERLRAAAKNLKNSQEKVKMHAGAKQADGRRCNKEKK